MALTAAEANTVRKYLDETKQKYGDRIYHTDPISIVIAGPGGSGVTCLQTLIVTGFSTNEFDPTGGPGDRRQYSICDRPIIVSWMDSCTSFPERLPVGMQMIRDAAGVLLCYSPASRFTFEEIVNYHSTCMEHVGRGQMMSKKVYLVATKADIAQEWEVLDSEGEQVAQNIGAQYLKISSKERIGTTDEDITNILSRVLLKKAEGENARQLRREEAEKLADEADEKRKPSVMGKLLSCFRRR